VPLVGVWRQRPITAGEAQAGLGLDPRQRRRDLRIVLLDQLG
jgi:hypothetical protein